MLASLSLGHFWTVYNLQRRFWRYDCQL